MPQIMREESGRIELVGDTIRYESAAYASWAINVQDVRIVGEATNENGPFCDDWFLCFATAREKWHEASIYASGCDTVLSALSVRLGSALKLGLAASTGFGSRILWPHELAEKPMFAYEAGPAQSMVGRLVGATTCRQAYSDVVMAAFEKHA
jgi:hypothetical protein